MRADADAWARQVESEQERGVFVDHTSAERTLVYELLDQYGREVSPQKACVKSDLYRLRLLKEALGNLSVAHIASHHLASYRDHRLGLVSPQSVRHELSVLNRVMVTAQREWGMPFPRGIPSIRKPTMQPGRCRRLALGEEEKLLAALEESPGGKAAVLLALESAMRRGELADMRWEHINLVNRTLHIPHTKTGHARTIPLTSRAVSVLKALPRHINGSVLSMKRDSITQAFERACARAEINDLRFHDLRHEATTRLFEKGLNTMEVAAITGHRTLQMLQRYTHLRPEDLVRRIG